MDESILDGILAELSKNGTDKLEATDEIMINMNLKTTNPFNSNEISFLINEGYLNREIIPYYQSSSGTFNPARYFFNLTPQGLKFISEGGYRAKSGYIKRTLAVATQSRNWSIAGVGLALVALGIQMYYGSCNNPVTKPNNQPNTIIIKDTIANSYNIPKKEHDTIRIIKKLPDSIIQEKFSKPAKKKKKASTL